MPIRRNSHHSATQQGTNQTAAPLSLAIPLDSDFGESVRQNEIERLCKSQIASLLNFNAGKLNFKPLPDSTTGAIGLYSNDKNDMSQLVGKKVTPLLRWIVINEKTYWLGLRLNFYRSSNNLVVESVSITVARTFPGATPEGILRAEWASYSENQNTHAQPHWHIYNTRVEEKMSDEVKLLSEELNSEVIDFTPDSDNQAPQVSNELIPDKVEDFHLAMCAYWGRNHPIICWPIKQQDIGHWIKHCVSYIESQLKYIN